MLLADMETLLPVGETNVKLGDMPDTPNNITVLYDTGGYNPSHSFTDKEFEQLTFQVKVRDSSYASGYARCEAIKDAFDGRTNVIINEHSYISIFQQGDILLLGKDIKNRTEFSLNFVCKVKR